MLSLSTWSGRICTDLVGYQPLLQKWFPITSCYNRGSFVSTNMTLKKLGESTVYTSWYCATRLCKAVEALLSAVQKKIFLNPCSVPLNSYTWHTKRATYSTNTQTPSYRKNLYCSLLYTFVPCFLSWADRNYGLIKWRCTLAGPLWRPDSCWASPLVFRIWHRSWSLLRQGAGSPWYDSWSFLRLLLVSMRKATV